MGREDNTQNGLDSKDSGPASEKLSKFELTTNSTIDALIDFLQNKPNDFDQVIEGIISHEAKQRRVVSLSLAKGLIAEVYVRHMLMLFDSQSSGITIDPIPHDSIKGSYRYVREIEGGLKVLSQKGNELVTVTNFDGLVEVEGLPLAVEVKAGYHGNDRGFSFALTEQEVDKKLELLSTWFERRDFGFMAVGVKGSVYGEEGNVEKFKQRGGVMALIPITGLELDNYATKLEQINKSFRTKKNKKI